MLDIMKSIYDMMGKYTYPCMQEDAPREHVENFFQVIRKGGLITYYKCALFFNTDFQILHNFSQIQSMASQGFA